MKALSICCFVLQYLSSFVSCQNIDETWITTDEGQQFKIGYDSKLNLMRVQAIVSKSSILNIGFGTRMEEVDTIVMNGDEATLVDSYCYDHNVPVEDERQNYFDKKMTVQSGGGSIYFSAYRDLSTNDELDYDVPLDESFTICWTETEIPHHFVVGSQAKITLSRPIWNNKTLIHSVLLWFVWTFGGFYLIGTNRWWSYQLKGNQNLHTWAGFIVTALTVISSIERIIVVGTIASRWHAWAGAILGFICIIISANGYVALYARHNLSWSSGQIKFLRRVHVYLSYVYLGFILFAITTGFHVYFDKYAYSSKLYIIGPLNLLITCIVYMHLECNYRVKRQGLERLKVRDLKAIMTEQQFEDRVTGGEKLWVLDDLVLEAGDYVADHPGGNFLLDYTVGRDITKYFHGSYGLDGNQGKKGLFGGEQRYLHSNIARKVAKRLSIAILARNVETEQLFNVFTLDHTMTNAFNETTRSFVFQIYDPEGEMSENGKTKGIPGVQRFYTDLHPIGKHYMVTSLGQASEQQVNKITLQVNRQYTIANCMRKDMYNALLAAIEEYVQNDGVVKNFPMKLLSNEPRADITLTIKKYYSPNGLSQQFFQFDENTPIEEIMKDEQLFHVRGPMGKGLCLSHHSEGVHVAFTAGTGSLVFVDLANQILLGALGLIPPEERMRKTFRFIFFVSFRTLKDSTGYELLQGIEKVKEAHPNFRLRVRFSDQKMARWTPEYIEKQLMDIKNEDDLKLERIWVCGPPVMQEEFDKTLTRLAPRLGLNKNTQIEVI